MANDVQSWRWDLTDLFPDVAAYETELKALTAKAEHFGRWREKLNDLDRDGFMELLREFEELSLLAHRLVAYAALEFYADSRSEAAQARFAHAQSQLGELSAKTLFFEVWWKHLEDAKAKALIEAAGPRYAYWLSEMRSWRPFTLGEEAERAITLKNTVARAQGKIYETINDRYTFAFEAEGTRVEAKKSELSRYTRHQNPAVRKAAYDAMLERYREEAMILGELYRLVAEDWKNEYVKLRGFPTPISARNKMNDLPDAVVEALLKATEEGSQTFQAYFRLKARALGMKRLSRYDLYAPVGENERQYTFDEAVALVSEAFRQFDPEFEALMRQVIEARHIDVFPRDGKRSGAFSYGPVPGMTPYVLLNFQGQARDVATLAHELGHSVHSLLAASHPVFTFHPPLPLAESASTFGEMLLVDRLLATEQDPRLRKSILFHQLDGFYGTILRQAYFARFEIEAHDLLTGGAPLEAVHSAYLKTLKDQFGDAVEVPEHFQYEWLMVPHFYHTPFYVYAYAFGQLLVLSLYRRYQTEGQAFVPKLKRILAAGGSQNPAELLQKEGFDIEDPGFWLSGFELIGEHVARLEAEMRRESN